MRVVIVGAGGISYQHAAAGRALELFDAAGERDVIERAPVRQFELRLAHMRECLERGTPHRIPPEDSIAQMRVIDAVYQSPRTGEVAAVPRGVPA
jgi:predicted dehydrogenase